MGIALVLEAKVIVKPLSCSLSRFRQLNEKLCNLNYFNDVFIIAISCISSIANASKYNFTCCVLTAFTDVEKPE